ncbi:MAG: hypothetical protein HDR83_00340 [Bacteroides sp.]|nr:hypothetical protein [Barnesiella sp.]MBD5254204.1 hypothetical protein [Barnesiella sp.]MBD5344046.1 hypothetical protein [Bacteroides sp.]MBD5367701.1 hypothetical protein [Bacteroides sp.]MDE5829367.1 hypothetical protein [Duncaniella sp.]
MGNTLIWILATAIYGLLCGGVYTWTSRRRKGTWPLFVKSSYVFTLVGLAMMGFLFWLLGS